MEDPSGKEGLKTNRECGDCSAPALRQIGAPLVSLPVLGSDIEMNDLIPATPSIDQLARIIGNVAAPAFLLSAVASFISVLISRISHVIDRSQYLHSIADDDASKSYLKADIPRLKRRAGLLNRSLFCSILAAILTALIIIVAFISAFYHVAHEYGVALLFVGALVAFCVSLIDLGRETRLALHDNDLRK